VAEGAVMGEGCFCKKTERNFWKRQKRRESRTHQGDKIRTQKKGGIVNQGLRGKRRGELGCPGPAWGTSVRENKASWGGSREVSRFHSETGGQGEEISRNSGSGLTAKSTAASEEKGKKLNHSVVDECLDGQKEEKKAEKGREA